MKKMLQMTEEDFKDHRNNYDGFCTVCNDVTRYGGTEPDAENYECHECGAMSAMGVENALISGLIDII